jgi:outer membrane protein
MRCVRPFVAAVVCIFAWTTDLAAQNTSPLETVFGISRKLKPPAPLPAPEGLQDHVVNGKLVLSLDDSIRLALANNTDVKLDRPQIDFAKNNLKRAHSPFDPAASSSFSDSRTKSPAINETQGASVPNTLSQTATLGYTQTFQTGTNFQTAFSNNKLSTNSSLSLLNPSLSSAIQFTITQPLMRNFGLFPNRAPILIAQRNLKQARANFTAQVANIMLQVIGDYWNVVLARENLSVQQKSLEEAQKSYEHDKKALSLGALPPLDIYRSESQVASRRVDVIHAEYALKRASDSFRMDIGADLDPAIRTLDLDLPDQPTPAGDLPTADIATALAAALANRPEFEVTRQQLASDDLSIRLAHNNLKPDLELSGFYSGNGVAGDQPNPTPPPPFLGRTGINDSLNQVFHFTFPAYGASLTLNLPIRRRAAEANLGDALVSRSRDQYVERRTNQSITLEVTNAVHSLEEAKLTMEAAKVATDLARDTLHADERKYELGAEPVFFVLDAQTQLAQAELNLIQSQVNFQLAVAQLDHATGNLLDHHHVQIVEAAK